MQYQIFNQDIISFIKKHTYMYTPIQTKLSFIKHDER